MLELMRFGAVYYSVVPPPMSEHVLLSMGPELARQALDARTAAEGALDEVARPRQAEPWPRCPRCPTCLTAAAQAGRRDQRRAAPRRALRDVTVPRFAYVRVHVHPIRYPAAYTTDWKARCAATRA